MEKITISSADRERLIQAVRAVDGAAMEYGKAWSTRGADLDAARALEDAAMSAFYDLVYGPRSGAAR